LIEADRAVLALSTAWAFPSDWRITKNCSHVKDRGHLDMALPSFTQHLSMLEKFGLVKSKKSGRVRTYELAPKRLQAAEDWILDRRKLWERRLDQLDAYVLTMKENDDEE
jgi:DNA-binding transcriptional ArsR family regulator